MSAAGTSLICDPVNALSALAMLTLYPSGSKLSVYKGTGWLSTASLVLGEVYIDPTSRFDVVGLLQATSRTAYGGSRSDMQHLPLSVFYAVSWLQGWNSGIFRPLFTKAQEGLESLQKVYGITNTTASESDDLRTQTLKKTFKTLFDLLNHAIHNIAVSQKAFDLPEEVPPNIHRAKAFWEEEPNDWKKVVKIMDFIQEAESLKESGGEFSIPLQKIQNLVREALKDQLVVHEGK